MVFTAVTLDAEIVAASSRGRRVIAADDYFEGMMVTALAEDEVLLEARVPLLARDTRYGFYESAAAPATTRWRWRWSRFAWQTSHCCPGSGLAARRDARDACRPRKIFDRQEA